MEKTKYTKEDIDFACSILDSWIKYNQYNPVPVVKTSNKKKLSNEFSNFNFENFEEKVTIAKENLYIEFVLGNIPINGYVVENKEKEYLGELEKTFVLSFIVEWDKEKKNLCVKKQVYSPIIFKPLKKIENSDLQINKLIENILYKDKVLELENIEFFLNQINDNFHSINKTVFNIFSSKEYTKWFVRIVKPVEDEEQDEEEKEKQALDTNQFEPCFFLDSDFYSTEILKIKNRLIANKNNKDFKNDKILDLILGKVENEANNLNNFENILKWSNCNQRPYVKWPSKHDLSLMQDVAVNAFLNEKNEKIFSVNGPPGTGKTTLLKEIVAGIIFEKARLIYRKKDRRWKNLKTIKIGDKEYKILPNELKELGVLVASNNNKAVENISKEWPKPFDLDKNWSNLFSNDDNDVYFSKVIKKIYQKDISNNQEKDKEANEVKNNFWGSISLVWGNKKNKQKINNFFNLEDNKENFGKKSNKEKMRIIFDEFRKAYFEIKKEKKEQKWKIKAIQSFFNPNFSNKSNKKETSKFKKFESKLIDFSNDLETTQKTKNEINSFFNNFFIEKFINKNDKKFKRIVHWKQKTTSLLEKICSKYSKKIFKLNKKIKKRIRKIDRDLFIDWANKQGINKEKIKEKQIQVKEFFQYSYTSNENRILLFYYSLQIIKEFILQNKLYEILFVSEDEFSMMKKVDKEKIRREQFYVLNFLFPVISTTFASVKRNFESFPSNSLGIGIIDEAGQASPFAALGFIERNKRNLIVGDPFQVKPVVSLPKSIINLVKEEQGDKVANKKADELLRIDLSIQELADSITKYYAKINKKRVGCPLKIHRRCQSPMFEISNKISYDETMINANSSIITDANTRFIDVTNSLSNGNSNDKENSQAITLIEKIIAETKEEDLPFIISPFKQVVENIRSAIQDRKKNEEDAKIKNKWEILKTKNVGTVHTFQGREANTVFFVLGGNSKNEGAIRWALSEPNIINVAVTRAKKELIVIGNKTLWQEVSDKNNGCFNVLVEEIEKIEKEKQCENSSNQVAQ